MSQPALRKNLTFLNMPIVESVSIANDKLKDSDRQIAERINRLKIDKDKPFRDR